MYKRQTKATDLGESHWLNLDEVSEAESQHSEYEREAEPRRTLRREWPPLTNSNDFGVDIPQFEGKLDLDEFLEWLHIVERIFEYKDVPEDKKVKVMALRLRKYVSLWWTNLCTKNARRRSRRGRR